MHLYATSNIILHIHRCMKNAFKIYLFIFTSSLYIVFIRNIVPGNLTYIMSETKTD